MSYLSRISAVLLQTSLPRSTKLAFEIPSEQDAVAPEMSPPPPPEEAPAEAAPQAAGLSPQEIAILLGRAGAPRKEVAPLTALPEADPAILDSVLQRARLVRDPADYLRLLSHDPNINAVARAAALPTMLMSDAMLGRSLKDSQTRESILDALRNLQMPAQTEARPAATLPFRHTAYPLWYPRGSAIF